MNESKEIALNDQQIVLMVKKDRNAFGLLYEKYFERLYLFIFKRVQDESLAGDLCQEAMLKAMFNIHKYEDRGLPFSAWLFRIASNEVNLYFRKSKKHIMVEIKEKDVQVIMEEISLRETADPGAQQKLVKALNDLSPEHGEIIDLRFFMGYSFREIAEFYAITEANAKMRLYRILERIKKGWETK